MFIYVDTKLYLGELPPINANSSVQLFFLSFPETRRPRSRASQLPGLLWSPTRSKSEVVPQHDFPRKLVFEKECRSNSVFFPKVNP